MGVLAVREEYLGKRGLGLGLEATKMGFLQKKELKYGIFRYSEGTFVVASGAHEVAQRIFSLQQVAFGFWFFLELSL